MNILHIITGLNDGGAEAVLYRLCAYDKEYKQTVISLMDEGKYGPLLEDAGVDVHCLNMPSGRVTLSGLYQLFKLIRKLKPDVVQTWMYHADLLGGAIARVAGINNIVWGIRHTSHDAKSSSLSIRVITRLCGYLSPIIPRKIVSCSVNAVPVHVALGYQQDKFKVIPNGYDFSEFNFNLDGARNIRKELDLEDDCFLIGCVARWSPQKDHLNLIKSLSLLMLKHDRFHCVIVGSNCETSNEVLVKQLKEHGITDRVTLMGTRNDIAALMSAFDIHVLPSAYGEAFPNVVAEAMACHTPCIVTDVGDAALIVDEFGWVVPTRDAPALCNAMSLAIKYRVTSNWEILCSNARNHVAENYSIAKMYKLYLDAWN